MSKPFEEDLERDARILIIQIQSGMVSLSEAAPFIMQLPGFEGGPDRLIEYAKWISAPERGAYRKRVAELAEYNL